MTLPKPKRSLFNMEIDEVSLVDKGANQHARVTIAKRAPEEDVMPDLFSEDGSPVDENALQDGDIVFDDEGNAYQFEAGADEDADEREPESVGKSAFFGGEQETQSSFAEEIRAELSKAFSNSESREVLSKAAQRIDQLEAQIAKSEEVAKSERDLRLTREYISKAAEYNLPVDPAELGPVLYRMAETMSYDDCSVIAKCLEGAGNMIFEEIGNIGGGDNGDVMSLVEQHAVEIGKSSESANFAKNVETVFDQNPEAYEEYLASQRGRY